MKRKVIEQLFEGAADLSTPMVDYFARAKRDNATMALAKLARDVDSDWVRAIEGTYLNAHLGRVTISAAAQTGIFDAGEWKSAFARTTENDVTSKIVLIDPPFAGGEIIVGGDGASPTLTIQLGQMKYVFERATKPSP